MGSSPAQMLEAVRDAPFITIENGRLNHELENGQLRTPTDLLDYFGQTENGELVYHNTVKPSLGLITGRNAHHRNEIIKHIMLSHSRNRDAQFLILYCSDNEFSPAPDYFTHGNPSEDPTCLLISPNNPASVTSMYSKYGYFVNPISFSRDEISLRDILDLFTQTTRGQSSSKFQSKIHLIISQLSEPLELQHLSQLIDEETWDEEESTYIALRQTLLARLVALYEDHFRLPLSSYRQSLVDLRDAILQGTQVDAVLMNMALREFLYGNLGGKKLIVLVDGENVLRNQSCLSRSLEFIIGSELASVLISTGDPSMLLSPVCDASSFVFHTASTSMPWKRALMDYLPATNTNWMVPSLGTFTIFSPLSVHLRRGGDSELLCSYWDHSCINLRITEGPPPPTPPSTAICNLGNIEQETEETMPLVDETQDNKGTPPFPSPALSKEEVSPDTMPSASFLDGEINVENEVFDMYMLHLYHMEGIQSIALMEHSHIELEAQETTEQTFLSTEQPDLTRLMDPCTILDNPPERDRPLLLDTSPCRSVSADAGINHSQDVDLTLLPPKFHPLVKAILQLGGNRTEVQIGYESVKERLGTKKDIQNLGLGWVSFGEMAHEAWMEKYIEQGKTQTGERWMSLSMRVPRCKYTAGHSPENESHDPSVKPKGRVADGTLDEIMNLYMLHLYCIEGIETMKLMEHQSIEEGQFSTPYTGLDRDGSIQTLKDLPSLIAHRNSSASRDLGGITNLGEFKQLTGQTGNLSLDKLGKAAERGLASVSLDTILDNGISQVLSPPRDNPILSVIANNPWEMSYAEYGEVSGLNVEMVSPLQSTFSSGGVPFCGEGLVPTTQNIWINIESSLAEINGFVGEPEPHPDQGTSLVTGMNPLNPYSKVIEDESSIQLTSNSEVTPPPVKVGLEPYPAKFHPLVQAILQLSDDCANVRVGLEAVKWLMGKNEGVQSLNLGWRTFAEMVDEGAHEGYVRQYGTDFSAKWICLLSKQVYDTDTPASAFQIVETEANTEKTVIELYPNEFRPLINAILRLSGGHTEVSVDYEAARSQIGTIKDVKALGLGWDSFYQMVKAAVQKNLVREEGKWLTALKPPVEIMQPSNASSTPKNQENVEKDKASTPDIRERSTEHQLAGSSSPPNPSSQLDATYYPSVLRPLAISILSVTNQQIKAKARVGEVWQAFRALDDIVDKSYQALTNLVKLAIYRGVLTSGADEGGSWIALEDPRLGAPARVPVDTQIASRSNEESQMGSSMHGRSGLLNYEHFSPLIFTLITLRNRHSIFTPLIQPVIDTILKNVPGLLARTQYSSMTEYLDAAVDKGLVQIIDEDDQKKITLTEQHAEISVDRIAEWPRPVYIL